MGMNFLKKFEAELSRWPNVPARSHHFGGREFLHGSAELGHVHVGGVVDIPFPRSVGDALLAEGLAGEAQLGPKFRSDHISGAQPVVFDVVFRSRHLGRQFWSTSLKGGWYMS